MPKEIIGGVSKKEELYYIITGSRKLKVYTVEESFNGEVKTLNKNLTGIQEARRFIASHVYMNFSDLPIIYVGDDTIINDYCVVPGRAESKNAWNQWRIGSYK